MYKSYPAELVGEILTRYLADTTLEKLALDLGGVSAAGAQRVVDQAIIRGVLCAEDKHKSGGGFARKRARLVWERHPEERVSVVARLAGCAIATAYRAKISK